MAESTTKILRIAGHDYKVRGAESAEQLHQIERCLNDKIGAVRKLFSAQGMDFETITMLAAINLADDYIKVDKQLQQLKAKADKLAKKEKQLQEAVDRYEEDLLRLENENQDYAERLKKTRKGPEK